MFVYPICSGPPIEPSSKCVKHDLSKQINEKSGDDFFYQEFFIWENLSRDTKKDPQGNSTLLDSAEESVVLDEDGATEADAEREGSEPTQISRKQKRRNRQRLYRQRKKMTDQLSKLSTNPTGQGNHDSAASGSTIAEAEPRNPLPLGPADSIAAKRGRPSPGENPESKRVRRREETHPGLPSYSETTRMNLVLSIIPLDSVGNKIKATAGDKKFIHKMIERFIAEKNPKIDVAGLSFNKYGDLILTGHNQKTLEVVKTVVCPLKGPGNNLKGYLCLAPEDKPPLTTYYVWVKDPVVTNIQFINLLKDKYNWDPRKLTVKSTIPKPGGSTFVIGVESEIKTELEKLNFNLRYGVGRTAIFNVKSKRQPTRGGEAPQN